MVQVALLVVYKSSEAVILNVGDKAKSSKTKYQFIPLQDKMTLSNENSTAPVPVLVDHTIASKNVIQEYTKRILRDQQQTSSKAKMRQGRRNRPHKRTKSLHRLPSQNGFSKKSCGTRSSYVYKTEAEDIFGDTVSIYPVIEFGKVTIDQYFHETYCLDENCACAGIDSKHFTSFCETTHSYTYARAVKNGNLGWTFVKVRSGCACIINEKQHQTSDLQHLL
ncbi:hypothetical protein DPMN_044776 [Dreissena polymorpha]|uniref:Nerve growth factor-related domain-containing protein n=1 Tax=Dreissena polymorpha TaxID=45954 RepID=A0A9D4D313_DREPO|nr:hypothetical protein DPMN_044776 [Dreissena polymorpha]